MPKLRLPDGVELHWEERGEGPLVVVSAPCVSLPDSFFALADDLVRDHRVVFYDPRGTGRSTRTGPYEILTDAADQAALLRELGEPAVLIAFGDALHRAVETAALEPELVAAILSPGAAAFGRGRDYAGVDEGLASSPAVVGALVRLFETDYRAGLHAAVQGGNPQFTPEQVQQRIDRVIEYAPLEATLGRLRGWISHNSVAPARALGDRLWILIYDSNPWFPAELEPALRRDVPEAHMVHVENGAVSRPDLTAEVVRRITRC
ncbi:MAG TPA: alpha/beta hydrolase [Thermoleophilaceae bacterium]